MGFELLKKKLAVSYCRGENFFFQKQLFGDLKNTSRKNLTLNRNKYYWILLANELV